MPFEILHGTLVLLGGGAAVEGTEIAASAGLRIYLARIEPVFAGRQFADHWRVLGNAPPPNIMGRVIIIADKAVLFSRARRARAMSNSAFCLPPPPLAVTRVGEPSNPERDAPSCCGATLCGSPPANKGKRNAGRRGIPRPVRKRRTGRATEKAACAALPLRARSPAGVPPRHLRQRPNATAQLQFTHFLGRGY